jgi:drug/metabolite transporter (DMT)-like permease
MSGKPRQASRSTKRRASLAGVAAILFWSTTVPAARATLERLGTYTGAAAVFLLAGSILVLGTSIRHRGWAWLGTQHWRYFGYCGPLFVAYMCGLYFALGESATREQVLLVGLVNYLWPTMVLIFAFIFLRPRPRAFVFFLGTAVSLSGVLFAVVDGHSLPKLLQVGGSRGIWPFVVAFLASAAWGLYSILTARHSQTASEGAIGLLLLGSGLVMLVASILRGGGHSFTWTALAVGELLYVVLFPVALSYWLWDVAMRDGDVTLLGTLSNGIPILSTIVSSAYLSVGLSPRLLIAAAAVVCGALLSRAALRRAHQEAAPS